MNVIPNKECILIVQKFELNCIFRIKSDSFLDLNESDLIRNMQFNSNLCIINMHSSFGITFILYLLELSAGKELKFVIKLHQASINFIFVNEHQVCGSSSFVFKHFLEQIDSVWGLTGCQLDESC